MCHALAVCERLCAEFNCLLVRVKRAGMHSCHEMMRDREKRVCHTAAMWRGCQLESSRAVALYVASSMHVGRKPDKFRRPPGQGSESNSDRVELTFAPIAIAGEGTLNQEKNSFHIFARRNQKLRCIATFIHVLQIPVDHGRPQSSILVGLTLALVQLRGHIPWCGSCWMTSLIIG
jgi:hypothetical protein